MHKGRVKGEWEWRPRKKGKRKKKKGKCKCYCGCLLVCTSLELSTVCNALEVLLLRDGWSKWICNASNVLSASSVLCCDSTEKLLMLTEVGVTMAKVGCEGMELCPWQVSVWFLMLLCSLVLMEPNVVADKPACSKLRVNRQWVFEPMYNNSHLSHTYL